MVWAPRRMTDWEHLELMSSPPVKVSLSPLTQVRFLSSPARDIAVVFDVNRIHRRVRVQPNRLSIWMTRAKTFAPDWLHRILLRLWGRQRHGQS